MTTFFLYSAILLAVALLFVAVPVIRYRPGGNSADTEIRKRKNIEVFKQSLGELEKDKDEQLISLDEFEKLKTELERSFLRDMEDEETRTRGAAAKVNKLLPALCLLFIPIFSYSLYQVVGSARDLVLPEILNSITQAQTEEEQLQGLNNLADHLQGRFDRNPDDIRNGYMLGTLYIELEKYREAEEIFGALADEMDPSPDKATVLGQLAQSMYLAAGSQLTPEVQEVIDQALELNPSEYNIMSLLAIDSFIKEDFAKAVSYWRRQLVQLDSGSREATVLKTRIAQIEAMIPDLADGSADRAAAGGASVSLIIDLDDSVKELVDDSMRLFVYARNPAMPMPLAARNIAIPEFPFEITLDDSMAMIANLTLSTAKDVIVGARLSHSGQATAQPGDIQAVSEPFVLAEQDGPVTLTIKDIVQ